MRIEKGIASGRLAAQPSQPQEQTAGRRQRLRERLRQDARLQWVQDPLVTKAAFNLLLILTW